MSAVEKCSVEGRAGVVIRVHANGYEVFDYPYPGALPPYKSHVFETFEGLVKFLRGVIVEFKK